MSTVLVTGGSSALGRSTIDGLLPGHRILAIVHRRPVDTRAGQVELLAGGLERSLDHAARIREADVIVHLAGVTHSDDASQYERANHLMTRCLLAAARPGQRLVYLSSLCAHPEGGAYGASKWRAEEAVRASELEWVIARPAEVYDSKAGEGIDALIDIALRWRVLADFRHGGSVRYAPVSANRVAHFLASVVNRFVRPRALYTLCADRACTAPEIAQVLGRAGKRVACVPVPVRLLRAAVRGQLPVPFKPDQLDRLTLAKEYDNRAARQDYGFDPGDFLADLARRVA